MPCSRYVATRSLFPTTMASKLSLLLVAITPFAGAQECGVAQPYDFAVTNVQPLDTVILGQYGHSPSVMPSRESVPTLWQHLLATFDDDRPWLCSLARHCLNELWA
jgi:hypothetical protein